MKINVYYEDKNCVTNLDVSDEECAVWVEADYQKKLKTADDKSKVERRTPQQIMDEDCNKPTFNSHQRETRRHVSLNAFDPEGKHIPDKSTMEDDFLLDLSNKELTNAIKQLEPNQQNLWQIYFGMAKNKERLLTRMVLLKWLFQTVLKKFIKNLKKFFQRGFSFSVFVRYLWKA